MPVEHLVPTIVFFNNSQIFQPFSCLRGFFNATLTLAVLPVLIKYLEEVFRKELLGVDCGAQLGLAVGVEVLLIISAH